MFKNVITLLVISTLGACDIPLLMPTPPSKTPDSVCKHLTSELEYKYNSGTVVQDVFTGDVSFFDLNTEEITTISGDSRGQFKCTNLPER